jgi:DNA repair protein RAD5
MVELYTHQREAIEWMRVTESRSRIIASQPHGGILAHAMGLGKTITMLSFILGQAPMRTLVVCPKSLVLQWESETRMLDTHTDVVVYHGTNRRLPAAASSRHQIIITTFEIVRLENRRGQPLHDVTWGRVVLDEAHRICEQSSKTTHAITALRAPNRWCITGTPFKNGISDLMALSKFLLVSPYCNIMWWKWYGNNVEKLQEWRRTMVHLRDKTVINLPPMNIHSFTISPSAVEVELETRFRDIVWSPNASDVLPALNVCNEHELLRILRLRQSANHPLMVVHADAMRHQLKGGSTAPGMCEACGSLPVSKTAGCTHGRCTRCGEEPICAACIATAMRTPGEWLHSSKTRALWNYLIDRAAIKSSATKVIVFSQWTTSLDLVGCMLDHEHVGYACYDGRINTTDERSQVIEHFRTTPGCQVLLTSLGSGGEGVNLTFATHVILMEPYWNRAAEQQAIDRIHRIGQTQQTHVAHFSITNSVEAWVTSIQHRKVNELQRLLYDTIVTNKSEKINRKRTFSQRLRPEFEDPKESGSIERACLSSFLVDATDVHAKK